TVTAKFTAESQQVKQILESNMDDLRRHLQENGIQVDSLMVSVGNSGTGNEQFARGSYNQDFRNDSGNFGYSQPADQDEVESGREETRRPVRDTVIDLIA
ncbi:MAG TPA: flagellar hook-length control protein FliK, partial [Bacillota bacterium]